MFEEMINNNLNKIIKTERNKWGISKRTLAKKVKTEIDIIENIENGIYEEVDFNLLTDLSIVLKISILDLMRENMTVKELSNLIRKEDKFV